MLKLGYGRRLAVVGRFFFALALAGLGVEHFIFNEFVTGRAPGWPQGVPGGVAWAYVTGVVFVATAAAILLGSRARSAALVAAGLIVGWALLRHIPVLIDEAFLCPAWTRAGKALVFAGGALAVAATFPGGRTPDGPSPLIIAGRVCLGLFLVITGIQHFMFTRFVAQLIPPWFPGDPVFWTYFAGVALIAGGVGLFVPRTTLLAALLSGLMVFSWFWIVHIPRTLLSVSDGIAVFEALAVSGIALVLAGSSRTSHRTLTSR